MTFNADSILRRYRGEWVPGNVAEPYMQGETVNSLGSIYYSNANNNSENVLPGQSSNWTLSAESATLGAAVSDLIGTDSEPVPRGSLLTASSGQLEVLASGGVGDNLGQQNGELAHFSTSSEGGGTREVIAHIGYKSGGPRWARPSGRSEQFPTEIDELLGVTSNNKIVRVSDNRGSLFGAWVLRIFDKSIIPRGEINGVREAVWRDGNYFYAIDVNNDLYAENVRTGELTLLLGNVRTIATSGQFPVLNPITRIIICTMSGEVYGWGDNFSSQLVPNETTNTGFLQTPVQITGLSNIQKVCIEAYGSFFAINSAGGLWSWGRNDRGTLGRSPATTAVGQAPMEILQNVTRLESSFVLEQTTDQAGLICAFTTDTVANTSSIWIWADTRIPRNFLGVNNTSPAAWQPTVLDSRPGEAFKDIHIHVILGSADPTVYGAILDSNGTVRIFTRNDFGDTVFYNSGTPNLDAACGFLSGDADNVTEDFVNENISCLFGVPFSAEARGSDGFMIKNGLRLNLLGVSGNRTTCVQELNFLFSGECVAEGGQVLTPDGRLINFTVVTYLT